LFDKTFTPGYFGIHPQWAIDFYAVQIAQRLRPLNQPAPDTQQNSRIVDFRASGQEATLLERLQNAARRGDLQINFMNDACLG